MEKYINARDPITGKVVMQISNLNLKGIRRGLVKWAQSTDWPGNAVADLKRQIGELPSEKVINDHLAWASDTLPTGWNMSSLWTHMRILEADVAALTDSVARLGPQILATADVSTQQPAAVMTLKAQTTAIADRASALRAMLPTGTPAAETTAEEASQTAGPQTPSWLPLMAIAGVAVAVIIYMRRR